MAPADLLVARYVLGVPLVLSLVAGVGTPSDRAEPDPTGLWLTEEETAVIRIERCGEALAGLCGHIHWLAEGGPRWDEQNPEPELRDRPLCGLELLAGFTQHPRDPAEWRGGELYAADEGSTYRGRIRVEGPDTLELRGYVGISWFGRSQRWVRVSGEDFPACEAPGPRGEEGEPPAGAHSEPRLVAAPPPVPELGVGRPAGRLVDPLGALTQLQEPEHPGVQPRIPIPEGGEEIEPGVAVEPEGMVEDGIDLPEVPILQGVPRRVSL